ncbi:MAG: bifunctional demethylmenaquinone methyltransferase/2-methoxy-6-polyprenyl-1,4-benzoquinol methylase UbiE [Candidatus Sericytochromatia bacterium]
MKIEVTKEEVKTNLETKEKSSYVHDMFDDIAPKYDFFNDVISLGMHRHWKKFVAEKAMLKEGDTALDLCCGTGDIAFELEKKVKANGKIYGLDFVQKMVDLANQKVSQTKKENMVFQQGDAMSLPFEDNTFNAVTIGYGLRNVKDIPTVIREMKRVTKEGGRIISLDLGKPTIPVYKDFYYFYFYKIMPSITSFFQGKKEAYSYLPNSLDEYPAQKGIIEIMKKEGLKEVRCYDFAGGATAIHVATV